MENDIAIMAAGYLFARLGALAAFGYLVYRVMRPAPNRARVKTHSDYARERYDSTRLDR